MSLVYQIKRVAAFHAQLAEHAHSAREKERGERERGKERKRAREREGGREGVRERGREREREKLDRGRGRGGERARRVIGICCPRAMRNKCNWDYVGTEHKYIPRSILHGKRTLPARVGEERNFGAGCVVIHCLHRHQSVRIVGQSRIYSPFLHHALVTAQAHDPRSKTVHTTPCFSRFVLSNPISGQ